MNRSISNLIDWFEVSIKSTDPDATYEQVAKIVETMWQALGVDQKKKYE